MSESTDKGGGKLPEPPDKWLPLLPGEQGIVAPPPLQTQYPNQPNVYDSSAPPPTRSLPPGVQGPVAPNLKIADKVLEGAAGKADDVHDAFYTPAASLDGLTTAAAKALEGFQTADALKRSHENWEEQAGLVTAWLNNISKSLRQAAHAYNDTDHGVRDGFSPYLKQGAPSGGADAAYPPAYGPYLTQNGGE